MTKYKWNIKELEQDINLIESKLQENNNNQLYDDLVKIQYMLSLKDNFDNVIETNRLSTRVNKLLNGYESDYSFSNSNDNHCKILKLINEDSKEILKSLNKYYLRKRRVKKYNRGLFEIILWTEYTFMTFDKNYYVQFNKFINSPRTCISDKAFDTWAIKLRGITKNYFNISFCNSLNDMLNFFHSFSFNQLNYGDNKPDDSIYEWTLEIFYYLIASDILKDKYYRDSYDIKYQVFNSLKAGLKEFEFIAYNNDSLEYDEDTKNYHISIQSSIYDNEMVQSYYKSINYKSLSLSIKNTYSTLLAIYLYNQYQMDKDKALKNIDILIKNVGRIEDNHMIEMLDIDIDDFVNCRYYDNFYKICKNEYKKKKRKL